MITKNKKVSFDYDGTLDIKIIQEYASDLIKNGIEVWICTSRYSEDYEGLVWWNNSDVYETAKNIGIPKSNIIFANMKNKCEVLSEDFIWHLDNDHIEIENFIEYESKVNGVLIQEGWKEECNELLNMN